MNVIDSRNIETTAQLEAMPSMRSWLTAILAHLQRGLRLRANAHRELRHLETLSLGPRKAVHLVECSGERFLVGDGVCSPVRLTSCAGDVCQ